MIIYIVVIVFVTIFILPLKIKFRVIYQDKLIHVYFFNKELNVKEKVSEEKASVETAKKQKRMLERFLPTDIPTALKKISKNSFKPKLKVKFELEYGFEDAAATGIMFGIFNGLNSVVYEAFQVPFKIKGYEFNVIPHFNNPMLNFRITSIISFNLAKIIYMLLIIYVFKGGES